MKVEIPVQDSETKKDYIFNIEKTNGHSVEIQVRKDGSFYRASLGIGVFEGKCKIVIDDVDTEGNFGNPKHVITLFEEN